MTTNKKFIYKVPDLVNAHCAVMISQPDVEKSKEDDVIQLEIDSYFMDGNSTNIKIFFNSLEEFAKFKDIVINADMCFNKFNSLTEVD